MNKVDLLKFIDLYNLGGNVEAVKIISDGKGVKTNFRTEDKTLAGNVSYPALVFEAGEYGINDTAQFKKMLSVLDDTIEVTPIKHEGEAISLSISDKNTESFCMLAKVAVIPGGMKIGEPKEYDVEIPITEDFIARFMKANNAVAEPNKTTLFALTMNKKDKLELVVGYSTLNSNRVRLEITPVPGKDRVQDVICFNSDYLREILSKNRGTSGAVLKVLEEGMAAISFTTPEYDAKYFMMKKTIES